MKETSSCDSFFLGNRADIHEGAVVGRSRRINDLILVTKACLISSAVVRNDDSIIGSVESIFSFSDNKSSSTLLISSCFFSCYAEISDERVSIKSFVSAFFIYFDTGFPIDTQ